MGITPEWIEWQVHVHWEVAWFFYRSRLQVMLRPFNTARPYAFPVLAKVLGKKTKPTTKALAPSLDWSELRNVLLWMHATAPSALLKEFKKKPDKS